MSLINQKKIIILEGIATSGKTTLKNKLLEYFAATNHKVAVVGEEQTLMPILHNKDKTAALKLLDEVIKNALAGDGEIIIFDRLYFTHIFRTHSTAQDFYAVTDLLSKHKALIVLLTVEKSLIGNRIFKAMQHRDEAWTEFVKKKGTDAEIVKYYTDQQDKLIELTKESKLPTIILDMTSGDYGGAQNNIINELGL